MTLHSGVSGVVIEVHIDVTTPRVRGVKVVAEGHLAVFTVGEERFEVDTGLQLGSCTYAACSANLGLASCSFKVQN